MRTTMMKVNKILTKDLPIDIICPFIANYEYDYGIYMDHFSSYDCLNLDDFNDPYHYAVVLYSNLLKEFLHNPKLSLESLQNIATASFFKKFSPDEETNKMISIRLYTKLVDGYEAIRGLLTQYQHIATVLDFHSTIGVSPRNAYYSYIDALMVDKTGTDLFLLIRREGCQDTHAAYNTKILAAIDYCNEASIKINNIYYIGYDWNLFSTNTKIVLNKFYMSDHIKSIADRFSGLMLPNSANLAYCNVCKHKDACAKNHVYSKKKK